MTTIVELRNVSRSYPSSQPVAALRDVSLSIEEGEFVTIMGPSGSGKSTLLNILGLLDRPSQGDYLIRGMPVSTLPERRRAELRAKLVGFVFQSYHLLEQRACVDNVMLADLYSGVRTALSRQRAVAALAAVGLDGLENRMPTELSGGQQQRVAIARALSARPSLLLCDEPTGNLDSANAASIMQLFGEIHRMGNTVVLITHDAGIAAHGTKKLLILDGNLREES